MAIVLRRRYLTTLLAALVLCVWSACAQPAERHAAASGPVTQASQALQPVDSGRTASRIDLSALGIPVALPGDVPDGFSIARIDTSMGSDVMLNAPAYTVRYQRGDGACFQVETASQGVGGPVPASSAQLSPVAFPETVNQPYRLYWTGDEAEHGILPNAVVTDWMGGPPVFYRIAAGGAVGPDCGSVANDVVRHLAETLTFQAYEGGAFDTAEYKWFGLNRPFTVTSPSSATLRQAAENVVSELGLNPGLAAAGFLARPRRSDSTDVVVTLVGLMDDSVAAKRYLIQLHKTEGEWVLQKLWSQVACQSGRGHDGWSDTPCL